MYCKQCGTNNEPGAAFCVQCGAPLAAPSTVPVSVQPGTIAPTYGRPNIPTYMVQSVLVTLCCCLPVGIACILKATKVDRLLASGDYAGAQIASDENKKLLWIGAIVGGLVTGIYVLAKLAQH